MNEHFRPWGVNFFCSTVCRRKTRAIRGIPVNNVIQRLIYFGGMLALTKPLGGYMAKVYDERSLK